MSSRKRIGRAYDYQSLEGRRLLAGNVTVVENVHLFIRGDAENNQFEVVADGEQLRINGLNGTTINNADSFVVSGASVNDSGVSFSGGLRAHLGPGNDDFEVRDAQFESLSIVYGGTGDDNIGVIDSHFSDQTIIQTFDGNDSVMTDGSQFDDTFRAVTLDGRDSVTMVNSVLGGNSIVVTGKHADSIHSDGNHYNGQVNLVLSLGGNDTVQLDNPVVGETQLGVFLGNGDDMIHGDLTNATIDGTVRIGGQGGVDQLMDMPMNESDQARIIVNVDQVSVFDSVSGGSENVTGFATSFYNSQINNYRWASEFQLESDQTVSGISWTGSYNGIRFGEEAFVEDDFKIEVFEGNEVVPVGDAIATFNVGNDVNRTETGFEVIRGFEQVSPVFAYSAEIDLTLEAGKIYWISISGATETDVPEGVFADRYNNFEWGSGLGTEDFSFVYTFGQQALPNPGWFNDFGPGPAAFDFTLWT